ncbi:hypothetical protein E1B28_007980 [Marasmius oreades]|uniref:DUF6534 domain-containing protein n=1 Tax=Marasmius oreades TaxID=181124 RepID=A0A9P7S326_9AGAR|nr:uncharacterized protein E1B28_007980 [Marasmius oreades]KAG7094380.1 hypothetical protein E1B28_007980 [Marasmius oreades]
MVGPATTIDNTLGLLFNVAIITAALWGAGSLQGWFYFRKYNSRDPIGTRLLIAFIMVADTVQEAMICEAVYKYAVSMHGDPAAMTHMVKTILIELFFAGAIGFAVQQFYIYRIFRLSNNNYYIAGIVSLLSFVSLALLWGYAIVTLGYSSLGELIRQQDWATALNVMSAVTDLAITVAMIWCLQGKKTGFRKSTDIINRMIIFTFNTGIVTTVLSIADVITLNTMPETFVYMGFFLIRDRFYTNSILVTLNSREYIKGSAVSTEHETISLGKFSQTSSNGRSRAPQETHTRDIAIRIEKSTCHDTGAIGEYDTSPTGKSAKFSESDGSPHAV